MGLFTELLLLPLAPLRATAWTVERVVSAAEREQIESVRAELVRLEQELQAGHIDEQEFDQREDELLDQLERLDAGATG